jgi:para-nitrobenzyl esterase
MSALESRPSRTSSSRIIVLSALLASALGCGDDDSAGAGGSPDAAAAATDVVAGDAGDTTGSSAGADGLRVTLDDGIVQGEQLEGARRYLAIPFAKPPLGDLRWKAPEPNDPWDGVRHQTEFVAGCPQLADQGAPASDNEDCLYLNVWAPDPAPTDAPVMVWIHGGGNFSGAAGIPIPSTSSLWYDGRVFAAKQGVVLVSIHYRLGPLGFFAHPALAEEGEPLGNQGLLDQRMALSWVQRNIAKFGGNPDNVTIFGESAGSADVCYHVASPGSRGLFHRAISQSGGCTIRSTGPEAEAGAAGDGMVAFGEAAGCPPGDDQLSCLREASVQDLLASSMQPMPGVGETAEASWRFAVVIGGDDAFLPDSPRALFDRGEIADVPYLLGANHDEGTTFTWRAPPITTEEEYLADLEARFGDAAEDVAALYPASDFDGDYNAARARAAGDTGLVCGTHDTARRAAAAGKQVFLYDFNVAWAILPTVLRAGHAAEISHVFGTPHLPMPDPDSEAVAVAMNTYWARFAATGDPNGAGAPAVWPAFEPDADVRLQLAPGFEVLEDFRAEECAFWRGYAGVE